MDGGAVVCSPSGHKVCGQGHRIVTCSDGLTGAGSFRMRLAARSRLSPSYRVLGCSSVEAILRRAAYEEEVR